MNDIKMGFRHAMIHQMPNYNSVSPFKMTPSKTAATLQTPQTSPSVTDFSISRILSDECEKSSTVHRSKTPKAIPLIKPIPCNANTHTTHTNSVGILDLSKTSSATANENHSNDLSYPFYRPMNYAHIFYPNILAATKFYAHFFPHIFPIAHYNTPATSNPPSSSSSPSSLSFPKRYFAPYIVNSNTNQLDSAVESNRASLKPTSTTPEDLLMNNQKSSKILQAAHSNNDCGSCLKYHPTDSKAFSANQTNFPNHPRSSPSSSILSSSANISLTTITNFNLTSSKSIGLGSQFEIASSSPSFTEEISYKCRICDKVFGCSETLQAHEKTHKSPRYECTDCGKGFSQLRNYKYHLSVHRGTKEFAAECPECGKTFNDKGYLSSHMKIHRNKKEYECPYCPKSFNQRVAFNMHVRIHTGVKPHKCVECGKRFSRKMLLKQHMRTHSGEKPYQCSVCGKSFADRSNMTLHHRLHSGIKPFNCPICPKAFTKKHHLKTHLNYHTGCKPYVCPHPNCNQAFTQSSNMRTHAKKCQYRPLQMSALPLDSSTGGQHVMPIVVSSTSSSIIPAAMSNAVLSGSTSNTPLPTSTNSAANLLASRYAPTSAHLGNVTSRHIATPFSATFASSPGSRMLRPITTATTNVALSTTSTSRPIMTAAKSTTLPFPPTQQPLLSTLRPL